MIKSIKPLYLLFYFILSLFFMEILLRTLISESFFSFGLLLSLIFLIPFAILFYIFCSLFQNKVNYILSSVLLAFSALVFSSQLVYYKFFRTFYSLYSAGNAGQVFEFWRDIGMLVVKNLLWIVLFFLPTVLIAFFGKKVISFEKNQSRVQVLMMGCIILFHSIGLTVVYAGERVQYSAYDLYYNSSYPILSAERLGLITTMRLDLQRLVTGWSPSLPVSNPYLPDPSPEKTPKKEETTPVQTTGKTAEETPEPTPEEPKIEYHTMDIDFDPLISTEKDKTIKQMHQYFQSVPPTLKNEYTGKYKGYNLIFITAEGFSPYAVHEDVTPTLYKLVHNSYHFTNFYNPLWGVSTSDGEYVACTSLIPKNGIWSFSRSARIDLPFVMGNQLKGLGYKTLAYHNHTYTYYDRHLSHPNMGYDYKGIGNGLNIKEIWPESDLEMMQKTVPEYINDQPFHAYYMTVSGHMQYNFFGNNMAIKNKQHVQGLPYSEQGKAYIATQVELDRALQHLLEQLEEAGIADKTLIALSADHYPYGLDYETIDELAGHPVERNFELYKSPFILYTQGMQPVTIDRPCSSLDIIPTLSNLLGLEYDSRLLMGRDIFSDTEPLVIFLNKSFITGKGRYNAKTRKFVPIEGTSVDQNYINKISAIVDSKFYYSAKILETDYYAKVLK